jgi:transcriptional regulator with XRE-family HTH domain
MKRASDLPRRDAVKRLQKLTGAKLRELRKQAGTPQKSFGETLGLSRTSISNIERGTQRLFVDQIYEAARALQTTVDQVLPSMNDVFGDADMNFAPDLSSTSDAAEKARLVAKEVQQEFRAPKPAPSGSRRSP